MCAVGIMVSLTGCGGNTSNLSAEMFTTTYDATHKLFIPSDNLKDPSMLCATKDYLVACNNQGTPLIELYDIKSGKNVKNFMLLGRGPLELLAVGDMYYGSKDNMLYVTDPMNPKLLGFKLDNIVDVYSPNPEIVYHKTENSYDAGFFLNHLSNRRLHNEAKL